jgi:hypothetical protein
VLRPPAPKVSAATAQNANVRTNVVNPSPSTSPYSAAATGSGSVRRHRSGTWRLICGAIRAFRASANAPATASVSAIVVASRLGTSDPAAPRAAKDAAPPAQAPSVKAAQDATTRRCGPPIVSIIEKPHGDQVPVAPAAKAANPSAAASTGSWCRST